MVVHRLASPVCRQACPPGGQGNPCQRRAPSPNHQISLHCHRIGLCRTESTSTSPNQNLNQFPRCWFEVHGVESYLLHHRIGLRRRRIGPPPTPDCPPLKLKCEARRAAATEPNAFDDCLASGLGERFRRGERRQEFQTQPQNPHSDPDRGERRR